MARPVDEGGVAALLLRQEVEDFLFREARLLDDHRYEEWEGLWDDEGTYWVPAHGASYDPDERVSLIYDDREQLAVRVERLRTGGVYAQDPPSQLRRVVSNVEIGEETENRLQASANFCVQAMRHDAVETYVGRSEYVLRRADGDLRITAKKVILVRNSAPLPNITFLL